MAENLFFQLYFFKKISIMYMQEKEIKKGTSYFLISIFRKPKNQLITVKRRM